MTSGSVLGKQLDWLLTDFVHSTPGVRHAVAVSTDGLRLAASDRVGDGLADQLAAATSGLVSLARGTAQTLSAGAVAQTIIEMADGYLFLTSMSEGSSVAVFTDRECDMGMVGYEVTMLAARVGHVITSQPRTRRVNGVLP
ncbi:MAG TPA: roadblock/LC7 domain-containing protein [Actinomycetota bacterium]|nr:roadblock/LC7 domain-containing protein [Actinomycetota bacterium]